MLFAQTTLPDWAAQALPQFPVVAIVFVAVWWILGNVHRRYAVFLDRLELLFRQLQESEVRHSEQLKVSSKEAVQNIRKSYESTIKKIQERHQAEVDRLMKAHEEHLRSKMQRFGG